MSNRVYLALRLSLAIFSIVFVQGHIVGQAAVSRYKFSSDIREGVMQHPSSSGYQQAAADFSYIGDYQSSLAMWDSVHFASPMITGGDSAYFNHFKPVDAREYILKRASHEKIIIINEAHHHPEHRVFTESLLRGLYTLGFTYFGVETITRQDSLLNTRKYPVLTSGYYSIQPQYGNLIRSALQEGYSVFAYDSNEPGINGKEREIRQAENIRSILTRDSSARIVIHCGFDHIVESAYPAWEKAMAGRLKEYTGIDPFTIDQVKLTETGALQNDNPFYRLADVSHYAVFADSAGNVFNGPHGNLQHDVRVYHPRTKWLYGRPHWVFENGRKPYPISRKITSGFPRLIFAYPVSENEAIAVPEDVIEIRNPKDSKALALRKGSYLIISIDKKGNRERFKIKVQ